MMADSGTLRQDTTRRIGPRIVVYGPSGSGKSTVARQVGKILSLSVVEMDALFHRPNWEATPMEEFRAKVVQALAKHDDGWVCDGNYSRVRDSILPMADTVVWLRLPFQVAYWRLLKRTVRRSRSREQLWGTNRESFQKSFMSRDSILLWGITHWKASFRIVDQGLKNIPHHATVIELRSASQVEAWLRSLRLNSESSG